MEHDNTVLEMQRSVEGSYDFRPGSSENIDLTVGDLRLLRISTLGQVETLIQRFLDLEAPKPHPSVFFAQLTQKTDSWFVEAGEQGLLYLTDIVPGKNGNFTALWWDMRFDRARRELVLAVLAAAFNIFEFVRITAIVPGNYPTYRDRLLKTGFSLEGTLRKSGPDNVDEYILGLLREEVPCHVTPVPKSILV